MAEKVRDFLFVLCFGFVVGCMYAKMVGDLLVVGTLKGYDQLMNLVLDDVKELLRGRIDLIYIKI